MKNLTKPVPQNITIELTAKEAYTLRCILGAADISTLHETAKRSLEYDAENHPIDLYDIRSLTNGYVNIYDEENK